MNTVLLGLLNVTITMSIVICLMLLTKNILKKKFTATCRFIILSLIMLRLCIPIGLIMPIINIELPSPAPSENTNNDYIPKPPYLPETDFETLYTLENDNSVSSNINTPNDTDKITNSTPTTQGNGMYEFEKGKRHAQKNTRGGWTEWISNCFGKHFRLFMLPMKSYRRCLEWQRKEK